jgi:hypothetical protein
VGLGATVLVGFGAAHFALAPLNTTLAGVFERAPDDATWMLRGGLVVAALGAGAVTALVQWAALAAARRRKLLPIGLGVACVAAALGLIWGDMNLLVALYASVHEMAELLAWMLAATGASLLMFTLARWSPAARLVRFAAACGVAWTLWLVCIPSARAAVTDKRLAHVWREPAYAGRMSLRAQLIEDYLRNPSSWKGTLDARLGRLVQRYDIATVALSPVWDLPRASADDDATIAATAPVAQPMNVVVVFVDTLRADVAANAALMPNLAALRAQSLDFRRSYTTASDTVSSLPVLTGGCYGVVPCSGDMLALARAHGVKTNLAIAKSARRFLDKNTPHFAFDEVSEVVDYEDGKKVWGYGADQSTAAAVTERTLAWIDAHAIDAHPGERFLAWSFHFDVHNWMHLDENYLRDIANERGISQPEGDRNWRYRAASAGVDAAIGELVAGLAARGRDRDTAILLVSDHGEGLGRQGHAYHAVYLWESLVHVPMVLRVPGVPAARIDVPVGHVDVAPTVAALLVPGGVDARGYHGSSLLAPPPPGALPLLMFSMRKDDLLRIGVIDRQAPHFKLELPLDSVEPELYDLMRAEPDAANVRAEHRGRTLGLLSALVTSPVFPRPDPEQIDAASAAGH